MLAAMTGMPVYVCLELRNVKVLWRSTWRRQFPLNWDVATITNELKVITWLINNHSVSIWSWWCHDCSWLAALTHWQQSGESFQRSADHRARCDVVYMCVCVCWCVFYHMVIAGGASVRNVPAGLSPTELFLNSFLRSCPRLMLPATCRAPVRFRCHRPQPRRGNQREVARVRLRRPAKTHQYQRRYGLWGFRVGSPSWCVCGGGPSAQPARFAVTFQKVISWLQDMSCPNMLASK